MNNRTLAISAIVLVAVIMGMSAFAPAISNNLATDSSLTENTILPSAWANCHQGDEGDGGDGDDGGDAQDCIGKGGPEDNPN